MLSHITYTKVPFNVKTGLENPKKTYYWHILAWLLLITYELYTISFAMGIVAKLDRIVTHYVINIFFFYLTSLWVIPYSLRYGKQWVWRLPIFLAAAFSLLIISKGLLDLSFKLMDKDLGRALNFNARYIGGAAWRSLYFLALAFLFYYFRTYVKERDIRENLERLSLENQIKEQRLQLELTQAKLVYLKAQINPHFLFNTLNYIFSLIQKSEPKAAEAVVRLSKIMRFALDAEHAEENPPLSIEIAHSKSLIDLWLIPKSGTAYLNFNVDREVYNYHFIHLVLLTLLENIFKHGNLSDPSAPGIFNLLIRKDKLVVETINLINTDINSSGESIGLDNLKERLNSAYGSKCSFSYKNTLEGYFSVQIEVELAILKKVKL
ncbi:hypothetical protein DBR40_22230 [Pedobacter sp. KBW01]|uniref:sensor histidine kinase n=1 Tax=Pedobacter sp. KBW01 TaxID=2153364 RepID=UPI000F5B1E09|nr:sensor histidine kinase [Pedobacter sp. KBW01]RQO66600.1 hypothetical protein DBR40_22230 [Pedobacter sp. KBW01]